MTRFHHLTALLLLFVAALTAIALLGSSTIAAAPPAPGDLDSSFGSGGKVMVAAQTHTSSYLRNFTVLPGGKIVAVGSYADQLAIARYNADGALDESYGAAGKIVTPLGVPNATVSTVIAQPDGKIVVGGYQYTGVTDADFMVARYNTDGALDSGFATNGALIFDFAGHEDDVLALTLQADGKIVVAGRASNASGNNRFGLLRLTSSGALDTTFSGDGVQTVDAQTPGFSFAYAVTTDASGKIVAAGVASNGGTREFAVIRLNLDGSLDTTFSGDGINRTAFNVFRSEAQAMAVAADGSIYLGGYTANSAFARDTNFALARFTAAGNLDPTFGSGGVIVTDIAANADAITALAPLPDGGVVASGPVTTSGGEDVFALARYTAAGSLSADFGASGKSITAVPASRAAGQALLRRADGYLLLAGQVTPNDTGLTDFGLARYDAAGRLDPSFSGDGLLQTPFSGPVQTYTSAAVAQPDGKIVVVGMVDSFYTFIALSRFNPNGSRDTTFGVGGHVVTNVGNHIDNGFAVALTSDGKILVAGSSSPGNVSRERMVVLRYNADGSLDTTFGSAGVALATFDGSAARAFALAVGPDGKVLLAGSRYVEDDFTVGLARFNSNGSPDTGFGSGGQLTADFGPGSETAFDVAVGADGKALVLAGHNGSIALARYDATGALDPQFGTGGTAVITFAGATAAPSKMSVLPDGKILVAGTLERSGALQLFSLTRLNSTGALDHRFGADGLSVASFSGDSWAAALAVQPDAKIVLAGAVDRSDFHSDFALARFNADGSLDSGFGVEGKVQTLFDPGYARAQSVLIQPGGRILAVGEARSGLLQVAIAAYQSGLTLPNLTATPTITSIPAGCVLADVCPDDYWFTPVQYLLGRGAISGYSDNTFRPFNNATRGQLAKIVVSAAGWPQVTPSSASFTDVPVGSPFFSYVETAVQHNIISGYASGNGQREFRPGNNVTRAQLAKIIVLAEGWQLVSPATATFSDVATDNVFYRFIETAYTHTIISGYDVDDRKEFRPGNAATRAQIAKIVYLAVTQATKK